jgi:hypothetical protein
MSNQQPTVSVIFPTLNEAQNLPLVFSHLPLDSIHEVILVDGLSTDETVDVARRLLPSIKVVLESSPGKGAALRAGYRAASGDILMVVDADGSNDPREIPRFVQALLEGADFVKGSRFGPPGGTTDMPRIRKLGNGAFVTMVNLLFDATFTDLCYGYHAFWRYCLDAIDLDDVTGFEIDTALYLRALRERLRITEVPSFEGYRFHGIGKLQTIPDGWRVLRTILAEWWATQRTPPKNGHLGFRGCVPSGAVAPQSLVPAPAEPPQNNLQLLGALCRMLSVEQDMRGLLKNALRLTLETVQAASGSIVLMDDSGRLLDGYVAYDGQIRAMRAGETLDAVRHGFANWVLQHRQPAVVHSTRHDPRWLRQLWEVEAGCSRSAVGMPLMAEGQVVGVLTLVRPAAGQFSRADLDTISKMTMALPDWASAGRPQTGLALPLPARANGYRDSLGWVGIN